MPRRLLGFARVVKRMTDAEAMMCPGKSKISGFYGVDMALGHKWHLVKGRPQGPACNTYFSRTCSNSRST
jgi:hypothetical protein